jgi:hypothetical protein
MKVIPFPTKQPIRRQAVVRDYMLGCAVFLGLGLYVLICWTATVLAAKHLFRILLVVFGVAWMAGCTSRKLEIPFEPGKQHCVSSMTEAEREQAMAWKEWDHKPMNAGYDPNHEPGDGDSGFNEPDKKGRLFCPRSMFLSWDLDTVGTPPDYKDSVWAAHCYPKHRGLL